MHLYVRKNKNSWGLIWSVWKNGKLKQERVPKHRYLDLGFPPSLTMKEAKARSESLNAQETLKTRAIKRDAIAKRLDAEKLIETAFLTNADCEEFEQTVLLKRINPKEAVAKKLLSHWRASKRAIAVVNIDVSEWTDDPTKFYDYWTSQEVSLSYVKKLIPLLNQWGLYQARKYQKPFLALPFPNGREKQLLNDSYKRKFKRGNDSDPITPAQLEANRNNFSEENWNWLYLSVWFGLRPSEVDSLKEPQHKGDEGPWHIEKDKDGTPVLWVYQSKLVLIDMDKRWKAVPCFTPQQELGLKIIQSQNFKRPLVKTLKKYLTEFTTTYGGRKGFQDLCMDLGQNFEDASLMLGHTTIDTSWKSYKNRQKVRYRKIS
jgi:hypothetical protein